MGRCPASFDREALGIGVEQGVPIAVRAGNDQNLDSLDPQVIQPCEIVRPEPIPTPARDSARSAIPVAAHRDDNRAIASPDGH